MSQVPQTLEGWYVLHDIRRFDRAGWRALGAAEREAAAQEAVAFFARAERVEDAPEGSSALFRLLGHKGDLLVLHLRPTLEALHALEEGLDRLALGRYLTRSTSFVSVVELSQHGAAARGGAGPDGEGAGGDPDPDAAGGGAAALQGLPDSVRARLETRLKPAVPDKRHICFYPMNKRREAQANWFLLSPPERAELMRAHGLTGRKYAGQVIQVITGAMGLDDWEWGVTLFADDPLQFKKLVYEMRFDEVSARYAEFGPFYVGTRLRPEELSEYLAGTRSL